MNRTAWMIAAGLALGAAGAASAVELDPKVVAFKLPDQIAWVENARAGNRTAVLQGDPTKSGPYAMLLTWLPGNMSRPHFHPNDRFFIVVSGKWWVGSGPNFDPEATVPIPAGSHVVHYGCAFRRRQGRAGDDRRLGRRPGDVDGLARSGEMTTSARSSPKESGSPTARRGIRTPCTIRGKG